MSGPSPFSQFGAFPRTGTGFGASTVPGAGQAFGAFPGTGAPAFGTPPAAAQPYLAPPPYGQAFPVLKRNAGRTAYQRNLEAGRQVNLRPGSARPNNLSGMARSVERFAGLPQGAASARQGPRGNIYIQGETPAMPDWGGEVRTTHFSAHPPNGKGSVIGPFHAKTTGFGGPGQGPDTLLYQARAFPNVSYTGQYTPGFTGLVTPAQSTQTGYPAGSKEALVAQGAANAFSKFASFHHFPPRGGRKMRKKSRKGKTTKKTKTRKH
jgi:hypothetical protein